MRVTLHHITVTPHIYFITHPASHILIISVIPLSSSLVQSPSSLIPHLSSHIHNSEFLSFIHHSLSLFFPYLIYHPSSHIHNTSSTIPNPISLIPHPITLVPHHHHHHVHCTSLPESPFTPRHSSLIPPAFKKY